ncbi:periplasmic component [Pseudomonas syringae pv. actinidiae]|uniref:Periplasmic component n=1 Tax=Pseudomonas syringae pv. actinidiae TaxID=103796 RepID=A0A2V0QGW3_PSESF|nr:periplasmic component [Pseudomonas syringae pv. actinidiae]
MAGSANPIIKKISFSQQLKLGIGVPIVFEPAMYFARLLAV